jgi:hypothetical protein
MIILINEQAKTYNVWSQKTKRMKVHAKKPY